MSGGIPREMTNEDNDFFNRMICLMMISDQLRCLVVARFPRMWFGLFWNVVAPRLCARFFLLDHGGSVEISESASLAVIRDQQANMVLAMCISSKERNSEEVRCHFGTDCVCDGLHSKRMGKI